MNGRILSKFALPVVDSKSWVENALLVAASAGITFFLQNSGNFDFVIYSPVITAGLTMLLAYINKVIQNPATPVPGPGPNDNGDNFPI